MSKIDLNSLGALREAFPSLENNLYTYALGIPANYRGLFLRAHSKMCSPRQIIKANCQFCVGYEDTVSRIRDCSVWKCPLISVRPYQSQDETEDETCPA